MLPLNAHTDSAAPGSNLGQVRKPRAYPNADAAGPLAGS